MKKNDVIKISGIKFKEARQKLSLSQVKFSKKSKEYNLSISRESLQKLENEGKGTLRTIQRAILTLNYYSQEKLKKDATIKSVKDLVTPRVYKKIQNYDLKSKNNNNAIYDLEEFYLKAVSNLFDLYNIKNISKTFDKIIFIRAVRTPLNIRKNIIEFEKILFSKTNIGEDNIYSAEENKYQNILDFFSKNNIHIYAGIKTINEIDLEFQKKNESICEWGKSSEKNLYVSDEYNDEQILNCNAVLKKRNYAIVVLKEKNCHGSLRINYKNVFSEEKLTSIINSFNIDKENLFNNSNISEEDQIINEDDMYNFFEEEYHYKFRVDRTDFEFPEDTVDTIINNIFQKFPKKFEDKILREAQMLSIAGVI